MGSSTISKYENSCSHCLPNPMLPNQTTTPKTRKRQLSTEAEPTANPQPSTKRRKLAEQPRHRTPPNPQPSTKRQKLGEEPRHRTPPSFWDNLSRLWLCPRALREFNRRADQPVHPSPPHIQHLKRCEDNSIRLKRFARHGGPNLGDLKTYPEPPESKPTITSRPSASKSQSSSSRMSNNPSSQTGPRKTSAYDADFEQHLIDHCVYPVGYSVSQRPRNWEDINARLAMPRASLSPSRFTQEAFFEFSKKTQNALTEATVMSTVYPLIAGSADIPHEENLLFGNLKDLTDGSIVKAKPDFYHGATPVEIDPRIREKLGTYIMPSKNTTAPCLPNFFLEAKGQTGSAVVARRQACYDGALGARGIHQLRSYINPDTAFDNNAYTITATYHSATGSLTIYTTHPTLPKDPRNPVEYRMTQLNGWCMIGNEESFRQGASALRNARDWATEKRQDLMEAANNRVRDPKIPIEYRMTQLRSFAMTDSPDTFRQGASALRNARDWANEQRQELMKAANNKMTETHSSALESDTSTDELALD